MDDNKLRFGVGVLVIAAISVGIILTFLFGAVPRVFTGENHLIVRFPSADGITANTPVLFRGVKIGRVIEVKLEKEKVQVVLGIEDEQWNKLDHTFIPRIKTGSIITGDAKLEFTKADEAELIAELGDAYETLRSAGFSDGEMINYGKRDSDPFSLLFDLEDELVKTMSSIQDAGDSISGAGENVNALVADVRGVVQGADTDMDGVAQEAKRALEEFQGAMQDIRSILGNPELQADLEGALEQIPDVMSEAKKTLERFDRVGESFEKVGAAAERTVDNVDQTVDVVRDTVLEAKESIGAVERTFKSAERTIENIEKISEPVAQNADQLVAQLMKNLDNLNSALIEARQFGAALNNSQGTVKRLLTDDEIYWQIRRVVTNVENASAKIRPILDDVRIFSDKIARDPRELGVRGALNKRPSGMGLK